jgi:hypothetical protein
MEKLEECHISAAAQRGGQTAPAIISLAGATVCHLQRAAQKNLLLEIYSLSENGDWLRASAVCGS